MNEQDAGNLGFESIRAAVGDEFDLFPLDKPIPYQNPLTGEGVTTAEVIVQTIDLDGVGRFKIFFDAADVKNQGEIESKLELGERVVILTGDGPIELNLGSERSAQTGQRASDSNLIQLRVITMNSDVEPEGKYDFTLLSRRSRVAIPGSLADFDIEEKSLDYGSFFDEGGKVDMILLQNDPSLLHQLRVIVT